MTELIGNRVLWAALVANLVAQSLKVLLFRFTEGRWELARVLETGGMPSSHSAAVVALATSVGMSQGWGSALFAVSAVFASIVLYDATGIRRAAGQQALLINDLVRELSHLFDEGFKPGTLKTLLGHTSPQVLVGSMLGAATALILFL